MVYVHVYVDYYYHPVHFNHCVIAVHPHMLSLYAYIPYTDYSKYELKSLVQYFCNTDSILELLFSLLILYYWSYLLALILWGKH